MRVIKRVDVKEIEIKDVLEFFVGIGIGVVVFVLFDEDGVFVLVVGDIFVYIIF